MPSDKDKAEIMKCVKAYMGALQEFKKKGVDTNEYAQTMMGFFLKMKSYGGTQFIGYGKHTSPEAIPDVIEESIKMPVKGRG